MMVPFDVIIIERLLREAIKAGLLQEVVESYFAARDSGDNVDNARWFAQREWDL